MAYVGRRVEVFWPPDGDNLEGNWYGGLLDGYEDGARGGRAYHVTYDDGDEEDLEEGEIAGGNIHLMDDTNNMKQESNLIEEGPDLSEALEVREKAAASDASRGQQGGTDTKIGGAPTGGDVAEMSYREIERPASPRDGSPSSSSDLSGEGDAQGFRGHRLSSRDGPPPGASGGSGDVDGACGGNRVRGRRPIGTRENFPQADSFPSARHGKRSNSLAHGSDASTEGLPINKSIDYSGDVNDSVEYDDDDDEDEGDGGIFGPERGDDIGVRGSYREDVDPNDEEESGYGDKDEDYDDQDETDGEGEDSFVEDYFLLSGNSSEWTPLRGADLVPASPTASRQQLHSREWFRDSSAGNGKELCGHGESAAPAATTTSTTEACISALRNAVAAAAAAPVPEGIGAFGPSGHFRSCTFRHDPSETRKGRAFGDGLVVGDNTSGGGGGDQDVDDRLMALGAFVNETALLEGAVEGVEDGEGGELATTGGVFVKVSFMDGGGGREGSASFTNEAMFRCKTLVHTTGSSPRTGGDDGGITAGWQNGGFQFETFHGGRLDELSSAAVLFSAHRRRGGSEHRGGFTKGSSQDRFLGQVVLPLHDLIDNLRPMVEPLRARSVPGVDMSEEDTKSSQTAGTPGLIDGGGSNKIENGKGCWRSLRGEKLGVFPAADRRGKISTDGGSGLHLRLRLSVSLGVKAGRDLPGVEATPPQPVRTAATAKPVAGVAPYATVGGGQALENGAPRQRRHATASESKRHRQGGTGFGKGDGRPIRNRAKGMVGITAIPRGKCFTHRNGNPREDGGGGRRRVKGAGTRWKHKPLTAAAASEHHGAALARQRLKAQEKIARENERLERRLKVIREAPPSFTPHSYRTAGRVCTPGGRHGICGGDGGGGGGGGGCRDASAVRTFSKDDSRDDSGDDHVVKKGAGGEQRESTAWRELYHEREALASAVETAAAETASARDRVEALRNKTLWTEANARSASLAVASLERLLDPRGTGGPSRRRATDEEAVPATDSAAAPRLGRALVPADPNLDGPVDESIAAELRRQEELYEALVETRRKAVTAAEAARLAREADLKELDGLRVRQKQAENRQARHQWRLQHETSATAAAAGRNNLREGHLLIPDGGGGDGSGSGGGGGGVIGGVGRAAESRTEDRGDSCPNNHALALPKDALERAHDLAMSLRVEVETFRLEHALEAGTQGTGKGTENGVGGGERGTTTAPMAPGVKVPCCAREEVDSLNAQLKSNAKRLEAVTFDRDAVRAEFQHSIAADQRSAFKESTAWLEHAALYLSKT